MNSSEKKSTNKLSNSTGPVSKYECIHGEYTRPSTSTATSTIRQSRWSDPSSARSGFLPMMATLSIFEQSINAKQLKNAIQIMVDRCPILAARIRAGGRYILDYGENSKLGKSSEDLTAGVGFVELHDLDSEKMERFLDWHKLSKSTPFEEDTSKISSISDLQLGITGLLDNAFSTAVTEALVDVECSADDRQVLKGRNAKFPRTGRETENNPFAPLWTVVLVHTANKRYSAVYSVVNHSLFDGYGIFGLCKELGRVYSLGAELYDKEKNCLIYRSSREDVHSSQSIPFVDEQIPVAAADKIYQAESPVSDDVAHLGFSLLEQELGVEQASKRLLFSTGFEAILARGQEVAGPNHPPSTIDIPTASSEEALAAEALVMSTEKDISLADPECAMLMINLSLQDVKILKQNSGSFSSNDAIQSFLVGDTNGKQYRRFSQVTNARFLPDDCRFNVPKNLLGNGIDLIHGNGGELLHNDLRTAIRKYRDEGNWRSAGGFHTAKTTTLDLNTWATFADTKECGFPVEFGKVEGVQLDSFRLQASLVLGMADAFAPTAPLEEAEVINCEDLPTNSPWSLPDEPLSPPSNKPFSLITRPAPNCYSCLVNGVLLHGGLNGFESKCEKILGWSSEMFQQRVVKLGVDASPK